MFSPRHRTTSSSSFDGCDVEMSVPAIGVAQESLQNLHQPVRLTKPHSKIGSAGVAKLSRHRQIPHSKHTYPRQTDQVNTSSPDVEKLRRLRQISYSYTRPTRTTRTTRLMRPMRNEGAASALNRPPGRKVERVYIGDRNH